MTDENQDTCDRSVDLSRRQLLSAGTGAAAMLAGFGAVTGTAAAWTAFDAVFDGCSEVRVAVSENDVNFEDSKGERFAGQNAFPPLLIDVILTDGESVYCQPVEVTEASTTVAPAEFGTSPVLRYRASADEKILGVIGNSPSREPLRTATVRNPNRCARTPTTPSIDNAECYQNRQ